MNGSVCLHVIFMPLLSLNCRTVTSGSNTSTSYGPTWAFTSDTSSSCANGVAKTSTWNSILMSTWKHTQVRKMIHLASWVYPLCSTQTCCISVHLVVPALALPLEPLERMRNNLLCDCRNLILVLKQKTRQLYRINCEPSVNLTPVLTWSTNN